MDFTAFSHGFVAIRAPQAGRAGPAAPVGYALRQRLFLAPVRPGPAALQFGRCADRPVPAG
ncbi:hypothetical protein Aab01nite_72740 [Paractinoplanes abujensis]|nr:hypothetical protein Aab01nite_72740 [Actinoplanes abujensis]